MTNANFCLEHSGHASRIKNLEKEQVVISHNTDSAHRRIDSMKNWVIAGMTSVVIHLGLTIVMYLVKAKAGS